jgi:hypothetical protein
MNIEKLVEVMGQLNFSFEGDRDSLLFTRGDYKIKLSIDKPQYSRNKYWQFIITLGDNVVHLDIISYGTDIIDIFSKKILEFFRDDIRSKKIDLILEN